MEKGGSKSERLHTCVYIPALCTHVVQRSSLETATQCSYFHEPPMSQILCCCKGSASLLVTQELYFYAILHFSVTGICALQLCYPIGQGL